MATINNGESGSSVRTKLNDIINKVEGVTSINNDIDVTGTVTADGLTVDGAVGINVVNSSGFAEYIQTSAALPDRVVRWARQDGTINPRLDVYAEDGGIRLDGNAALGSARTLTISTDDKDRALFASNGDISFYEDTGTTPKFFWDASAESLGIGTTSPAALLHLNGVASSPELRLQASSLTSNLAQFKLDAGANRVVTASSSTFPLAFDVNGSERLRIDASGSVGIGTSSPAELIHIAGGAAAAYLKATNSAGTQGIEVGVSNAGDGIVNVQDAKALRLFTNDTERMRIDSSGNVGIGTSSPSTYSGYIGATLSSTSGGFIDMKSTTGSITTFVDANNGVSAGTIGTRTNHAFRFNTNNTERMRIDSSGNLLVGTTSALARLVLDNATNTTQTLIVTKDSGGTGTHTHIEFQNTSGTVGSITTTALATFYNTSSDYRLKENVVPLAGAADRIAQIPVHRFNFIADPDTIVDGFLAHEVQAFVPEAVTGEKDAVDKDGKPVHQGIDQSKLVPLLTAALQEALGRIETLEAEVAALKA